MQDAEIAQAIAAGDTEAFAELFERYGAALHDFCASVLRNRDEARDVVQDTLVLGWERAAQLRDPSKLKPWLFAIARHEALRRLRARRRSVPLQDVEIDRPAPGSDPVDAVTREDAAAIVWAAAAGLSPRDQVLLELHVRQGLEGQELADAMGTNANHAYVLVNRLRARVDRSLGALLVARLGREECEELQRVLEAWDGTFSPLWRKRVVRHVDECEICSERRKALASPFELLPTLAAVMLPSDLRDDVFDRIRHISSHTRIPGDRRARGWRRRHDGFPPPLYMPPRRRVAGTAAAVVAILASGGIGAAITAGPGSDRHVNVSDERRNSSPSTTRGPLGAAPTTGGTAPPASTTGAAPPSMALDGKPPSISGLSVSPTSFFESLGTCNPETATVSAAVSDPSVGVDALVFDGWQRLEADDWGRDALGNAGAVRAGTICHHADHDHGPGDGRCRERGRGHHRGRGPTVRDLGA